MNLVSTLRPFQCYCFPYSQFVPLAFNESKDQNNNKITKQIQANKWIMIISALCWNSRQRVLLMVRLNQFINHWWRNFMWFLISWFHATTSINLWWLWARMPLTRSLLIRFLIPQLFDKKIGRKKYRSENNKRDIEFYLTGTPSNADSLKDNSATDSNSTIRLHRIWPVNHSREWSWNASDITTIDRTQTNEWNRKWWNMQSVTW